MRASYFPGLKIQNDYSLMGDAYHHLVHVTRLEESEHLLLLDGQGLMVKTKVESISKKELRLSYLESEHQLRKFELDLAIGMPKREALELSLKEATELGFRKIYLIRSAYSQQRYLEPERVFALLYSAMEQSNSPYLPEVIESKWDEIDWSAYETSVLMDSQTQKEHHVPSLKFTAPRLLVVGPEGGFSPEEISYLHARSNMSVLSLPTPILRTPTAVATGAGVILQSLIKSEKG